MEELEQEYLKHEVSESIRKKILDSTYLEMNIDDILLELFRSSKRTYRELIKNEIVAKFQHLLGKVLSSSADLEEFLNQDADYILDLLVLIADNSEIFAEIKDAITEDNYEDLIKLTDFAVEQYINNYNYIQGQRDSLNASLNGIVSIDCRHSDRREITKEFIRAKINEFTSGKYLEKNKQS